MKTVECKFAGTGKCCRERHDQRVLKQVREITVRVENTTKTIKPFSEEKTQLSSARTWMTNLRPSQQLVVLWAHLLRLRGNMDTNIFARIQTLMEGDTIYSGTRQDCPLVTELLPGSNPT